MLYGYYQLTKVQREKEREIKSLNADIEKLKQTSENEQRELRKLQDRSTQMSNSIQPMQSGLQRFFRKDYEGAIEFYNGAIKIDDNNPVLFDLKGYALLRKSRLRNGTEVAERAQDLAEAIKSSEQSVKLDPNYEWGHYNLALAYWEDNRPEQAVDEVQKFLEMERSACEIIKHDAQFGKFTKSANFNRLMHERCENVSAAR
jgi:tetratricopeptide (TPR) repeat protein